MNIYEIAEIARVSPSTVSKVINGKGKISAVTRDKILTIMAQNDFHPKISSNASDNIAVFYRKSQGVIFASSYAKMGLSGISGYFFDKEPNLLLISTDKIPSSRTEFQVFCHRNRVGGAIFLDLKSIDDYIIPISGVIPFVTLNAYFEGPQIFNIMPDDFKGMHDALEYLWEMGHTKIAISLLDQQYTSHYNRFAAYKKFHEEHHLPLEPDYILDDTKIQDMPFRMVYDSWVQKEKVPTAIVAMNDDTAVMIFSYLNIMGVRVPEDISIVGFDDYPYSIHLTPALTTVRQPTWEIGYLAGSIVESHMGGKPLSETEPTYFPMKEELIIRHSVKKLTSSHK